MKMKNSGLNANTCPSPICLEKWSWRDVSGRQQDANNYQTKASTSGVVDSLTDSQTDRLPSGLAVARHTSGGKGEMGVLRRNPTASAYFTQNHEIPGLKICVVVVAPGKVQIKGFWASLMIGNFVRNAVIIYPPRYTDRFEIWSLSYQRAKHVNINNQ